RVIANDEDDGFALAHSACGTAWIDRPAHDAVVDRDDIHPSTKPVANSAPWRSKSWPVAASSVLCAGPVAASMRLRRRFHASGSVRRGSARNGECAHTARPTGT